MDEHSSSARSSSPSSIARSTSQGRWWYQTCVSPSISSVMAVPWMSLMVSGTRGEYRWWNTNPQWVSWPALKDRQLLANGVSSLPVILGWR